MDTTNKQMLSSIAGLNESYQSIKENLNKINADVVASVCTKMNSFKKRLHRRPENHHNHQHHDEQRKINFIVEKNNSNYSTGRTCSWTIIPKTRRGYTQTWKRTSALSSKRWRTPELRHKRKDHINNLELKFNKMLQEIQHPIHSYIVNSEDLTQTS
jgi:hypothetical protein